MQFPLRHPRAYSNAEGWIAGISRGFWVYLCIGASRAGFVTWLQNDHQKNT